MRYEIEDRIVWTDVSSIITPGDNYFYGSIHELNKSSGKLTTLCIRAFNSKEEAEKWVKESFENRFPKVQYRG